MKYDFTAPRDGALSELLSEKLSFIGRRGVRSLIKERQVRVNGGRVGEDMPVKAGDAVEAYVTARVPSVRVVYADDNIVVADKPAHTDTMSLPLLLSGEYGELYPVHRLDVNTTGLVALARNTAAKEELEREFRARKIKKKYIATVVGAPKESRGTLRHWLVKDAAGGIVKAYPTASHGGAESVTEYETIGRNGELTVLALYPSTGRTHQLRVQLAAAGTPILGDGKYGDYAANKRYKASEQRLRAVSLRLIGASGVLASLRNREFTVE